MKKTKKVIAWDRAHKVLAKHRARLLRRKGVTGVSVAYRIDRQGKVTDDPAISIRVRLRIAADKLPRHQRFPETIEGVPVDVVEVHGHLTAAPVHAGLAIYPDDLPPSKYGTLGLVAEGKGNADKRYFLTCDHVLSGDSEPIRQCIRKPDGTVAAGDIVGTRTTGLKSRERDMIVDCALIDPRDKNPDMQIPGIPGPYVLGYITSDDKLNRTPVRKCGAFGKLTDGFVVENNGEADLDGSFMTNQILIASKTSGQTFSEPGDSGAVVVKTKKTPAGETEIVGLLVGRLDSTGLAVASHFKSVLDALKIKL